MRGKRGSLSDRWLKNYKKVYGTALVLLIKFKNITTNIIYRLETPSSLMRDSLIYLLVFKLVIRFGWTILKKIEKHHEN